MIVFHTNLHGTNGVLISNVIAALQKYNSLPADEKRGLVAKYMAAGGIKSNLQQMLSASESAAEILKHHGWSWNDLPPADRTKVIEDLLSDCYQREGITTQQDPPLKKEHPTNPLLNKDYYIHRPEQAKTMEAELEKSEVRVDASDIQISKMNLALGNKDPEIKLEPFAECQGSWKVVDNAKSNAKSKVSKEYEAIISLFKDLKAEHQNPGKDMKKILDDLQDGLNRVGKALDDLRNDLAASKVEISSNMDQAKAKALCQKLAYWKEKGSQHLDGLKALKRRIQALLEG
eukprot:s2664_g22.t1